MEYVGEETIVEDESGEGGWVETHHFDDATGQATVEEKLSEMTMDGGKEPDDDPVEEMVTPDNTHNDPEDNDDDDDDDEEACDMEEFAESGMLEKMDLATAVRAPKPEPVAASSSSVTKKSDEEDASIVKTRTYDLHITYDKYYQTPRLWVVGYDENRKPLTMDQMYEDVSQDHAKKTVTMETHPHLPGPNMASVHPCK